MNKFIENKNQLQMTLASQNTSPVMPLNKISQNKDERNHLRSLIKQYVAKINLTPPVSLEELQKHADIIIKECNITTQFKDFTTVLIANVVWQKTVAQIPYKRRILLLPQCLRNKTLCPAIIDEFGLLCEQCGNCTTGDLQAEAEKLGYVVLVAEGTTIVTKLLESGKVDCVIGVSCLHSLERSFPFMAAAAIPGIAIPLFLDGCDSTKVDLDWIWEAIRLKSENEWSGHFNLDQIKSEVNSYFSEENISSILDLNGTRTEQVASDWMVTGGKRWRPFLSTSVFKAINGHQNGTSETMKKLAIAVECFHKASLIHDDIEDDDQFRYGMATLHKKQGVPIALNTGDLLLGEGYRLIAECEIPPIQISRMLSVAAHGHRDLCLGQGEELEWMRNPIPLSIKKVLDIFRMKTAPAFEVALNLGAICAGSDDEICKILKSFSESLGIAYQIWDDLEDYCENNVDNDIQAMRPSLLLALVTENVQDEIKLKITKLQKNKVKSINNKEIRKIITELKLEEQAWQIFDHYKNKAICSLEPLQNYHLKSLLFRIVHKILGNAPDLPVSQNLHTKNINSDENERIALGHVS